MLESSLLVAGSHGPRAPLPRVFPQRSGSKRKMMPGAASHLNAVMHLQHPISRIRKLTSRSNPHLISRQSSHTPRPAMLAQLDSLKAEALAVLATAHQDEAALEAARVNFLGKKGSLTALSAGMRDVPMESKEGSQSQAQRGPHRNHRSHRVEASRAASQQRTPPLSRALMPRCRVVLDMASAHSSAHEDSRPRGDHAASHGFRHRRWPGD